MSHIRYSVTVIDTSDNCVFSGIIPSFEIQRVINLSQKKFGVDFYLTVSPVFIRHTASPVYIDSINYYGKSS